MRMGQFQKLNQLINQSNFALIDVNLYKPVKYQYRWFNGIMSKEFFDELKFSDLDFATRTFEVMINHYERNSTFTVPEVVNQLKNLSHFLEEKYTKLSELECLCDQSSKISKKNIKTFEEIKTSGNLLIEKATRRIYDIYSNTEFENLFELCKNTEESLIQNYKRSKPRYSAELAATALARAYDNQETNLFTTNQKMAQILIRTIIKNQLSRKVYNNISCHTIIRPHIIHSENITKKLVRTYRYASNSL